MKAAPIEFATQGAASKALIASARLYCQTRF
jgi:hypothetical protein